MKRIGTTLAALGLCVAAVACQSPQQKIANKEDMLTAAGFRFVPANTPQRQAQFARLPPHKFARQMRDRLHNVGDGNLFRKIVGLVEAFARPVGVAQFLRRQQEHTASLPLALAQEFLALFVGGDAKQRQRPRVGHLGDCKRD